MLPIVTAIITADLLHQTPSHLPTVPIFLKYLILATATKLLWPWWAVTKRAGQAKMNLRNTNSSHNHRRALRITIISKVHRMCLHQHPNLKWVSLILCFRIIITKILTDINSNNNNMVIQAPMAIRALINYCLIWVLLMQGLLTKITNLKMKKINSFKMFINKLKLL